MVGTGCRTSESTALTWTQLNLDTDPATVLINATINGVGQRQPHTKTRAGLRRLALPPPSPPCSAPAKRRRNPTASSYSPPPDAATPAGPKPPAGPATSPAKSAPNSTASATPASADDPSAKWSPPNSTNTATPPRQIADLGHARPSVTLDIYQTREAAGPITVGKIL
jgi:hypothetical protein